MKRIKSIRNLSNRRGFTLIESVVSFLILIIVSVTLLNTFSKTELDNDISLTLDTDLYYSTIEVAKAITNTSEELDLSINLTNYVPSIDWNQPDKLLLYNNFNESTSEFIKSKFNGEILYRYRHTGTHMSIYKTNQGNKDITVTTEVYKGTSLGTKEVGNLSLTERFSKNDNTCIATASCSSYYGYHPTLMIKAVEDGNYNYVSGISTFSGVEVLSYEKSYK